MGRRLLLVDDEEDIVWTLTRQLARERPDFDVEGFVDARQALDRLRESPPELLISDVRMPRLSGLELLIEARRAVADLPIILMTAYGTSELRQEVAKRSRVEYLEKPYEFSTLLATIDRLLSRDRGFSGAISLSLLPDLVQIHALSRVSGALRITREGHAGAIWFQKGGIVHAECGDHTGPEAFYELLRWEGGKFALDPSGTPQSQTIFESAEELLMEGCRRLDEERYLASSPASGEEAPPFPESEGREPNAGPVPFGARLRETPLATVTLSTGRPSGASEAAGPEEWARDLAPLLDAVDRVTGGASSTGVFECLSGPVGFAVLWDRRADRAVILGEALQGPSGGSRFRSHLATAIRNAFPVEPKSASTND